MPRVAFTTLGCKVNQFETEILEGLFKERGYEIVDFDQPADVYVINTCSVTHLGERKSRQLIRRAGRSNPEAIIAVTGCYAQVAPEEVASIEGVNVIVGTQDRQRMVDLVEAAATSHESVQAVGDIMAARDFEDIPLFSAPGRTRAFLKIQEGCTNFCTYCIIPYARGPLRSRPIASVTSEAVKLVSAGFKEIVLTGIHLGAYGRDSGGQVSLADAVRAILAVEGLTRLRLGSLESIEVSDDIIELMRTDPRLCPHLHLPLQSGSDRILKAMNRHYSAAEYRELVRGIQSRVPDIAVSTDVIVGFPGETPEDFDETLAFIQDMDFARIHVFPYSRRKGTPAATFADQVSEPEKKRRAARLQRVADGAADEFHSKFLGRDMDVLFEGHEAGMVEGLTGNYIRTFAQGAEGDVGSIRRVRLSGSWKDGLRGEILTNFSR